ncbi:Acetophenone carboxylase alpha subunit [Zhongshania aliphaticivorans]|uniref:Acetophenone carboxylase alpha subunit n=1 Tax=Zhongshania aliphaticivorans TaxID=1470434 RepID=A0A5S9NA72_9GAMM|nr:hydantoinase/oxoprolinase family protein [Zhongshania aliphaticivorans]CAA0079830.1 Acetophenone carboxylase alpha subunit [Zhongshania aliphaticivorans]CAA0085959.1 Acetophenone carboxylase alpha subunit [Zhongshania aliphaticivorans]
MGKLINIDNGGTLTDIWVLDGDHSYHTKTITTPFDLSKCFFEGLKKISEDIYGYEDIRALLQSTDHIRYSTTQGTNALVERKGPSLGLLLNAPDKDWCCEDDHQLTLFNDLVGNRVAVLNTSENEADYQKNLSDAVAQLAAAGASRVVVAYVGSDYMAQESALRKTMLRLFPKHLLGSVPVLYTSALCRHANPNIRLWTALFNAFLHPAMERFLYNTENELSHFRTRNPLLVYRNDGYSGRVAKTIALKTYSSGPRGGAEGALAYSKFYGYQRVITIDVGGTTTDIGLIDQQHIVDSRLGLVEGVRCSDPLAEIVSVGVGGGSIIRAEDGEIKVGPESVGGAPGPACFGMGGDKATITDALLVMGLLDPKTYFGGKLQLKHDKAEAAIRRYIAEPLSLSLPQACAQMMEAWAGKIATGIRAYTTICDNTVLMAFGGGGPMGVTAVAKSAGITRVLIPRLSAVFSAHGIGFSDIAHLASESITVESTQQITDIYQRLKARVLRDMQTEGYGADECEIDAWYEHESTRYELQISSEGKLEAAIDCPEILLSVRAIHGISHAKLAENKVFEPSDPTAFSDRVLQTPTGESQRVPVFRIEDQIAGATGVGPVVLEEAFWTCNVAAGWGFEFTANRDIVLSVLTQHDAI